MYITAKVLPGKVMEFARLKCGLISMLIAATNPCCLWSKMHFPFSEYLTEMWFLMRKSLPNIRGLVRFLHTMKLQLNVVSPNTEDQFTNPMGDRLLPVADLTLTFCNKWIFVNCNFL